VIQPFTELCSTLESEFPGDTEVEAAIQRQRNRAQSWIEDEWSHRPAEPDHDLEGYRSRSAPAIETNRSIFEDIDS
jgi:hypothetical protein